jgi:hypothetical protein
VTFQIKLKTILHVPSTQFQNPAEHPGVYDAVRDREVWSQVKTMFNKMSLPLGVNLTPMGEL